MDLLTTPEQEITEFTPAITWLNRSGDITICWTEQTADQVKELVRRKMAQGYSFFILQPRVLKILGNKKVPLTSPAQLSKAVGVVAPDSMLAELASRLGDIDVEKAVRSGQAKLARAPAGEKHTIKRAKSAEEVVRSQSVAVRPVVGG